MAPGKGWIAIFAIAFVITGSHLAVGQENAPANPEPLSITAVLEAATNLPQIFSVNEGQADPAQLEQAVEAERVRLVEILRNDGYLQASIDLSWPEPDAGDASNLQVQVTLGPRYTVGTVNISSLSPLPPELDNEFQELAAGTVGEIATSNVITTLSSRINWRLGQNGYPFVHLEKAEMLPQAGQHLASVDLRVDTGRPARFAGVDLSDVDTTVMGELVPLIPFDTGDLYSIETLATFRTRLSELPHVRVARADVVPAGEDRFRLSLRVKRGAHLQEPSPQANLGLACLIVSLGIIALRQALASAGAGRAALRMLSVAMISTLTASGCFLALRVFSFV